MRPLSPAGQQIISGIAQRHGFSVPATLMMLDALIKGNGTMAQFNHPEFAGPGQWMRGGMTMVSDMFNDRLKARVDALCQDLSAVLSSEPDLIRTGTFQSQTQGGSREVTRKHTNPRAPQSFEGFGPASISVPATPGAASRWWPSDLGMPDSAGTQDGARYAYFAEARRLAIDVHGTITVYDTLDHRITGFAQQQSVGGTLSFSSQHGLIDVAALPVVSIASRLAAFAIEHRHHRAHRSLAGDRCDSLVSLAAILRQVARGARRQTFHPHALRARRTIVNAPAASLVTKGDFECEAASVGQRCVAELRRLACGEAHSAIGTSLVGRIA